MSDRNAWRRSKTRVFQVYVLVDPRDGLPHYIGCTTNPKRRLYAHLCAPLSTEGNRRRRQWIEELREAGLRPRMLGLGEATGYSAATKLETEWIDRGRLKGWPLLNGRAPRASATFALEKYVEGDQ